MEAKKSIFKFNADCGRQGELEGLIITTKERVKILVDNKIQVYFGEVLGKHSEICGSLDADDFTYVSDNKEAVKVVEEHNLCSGFNPFEYRSFEFKINGEDMSDMLIDDIIDKILLK